MCSRRSGRHVLTRLLCACGATCERQQGDVARALDGHAKPTLVARADAGHATRQNLAAFLHELRQDVGALVVDEVHLLDAELANFFLAEILALAATRSTRTTGSAARPAFTARAAMPATGAATTVAAAVTTATITPGRCATRC